MGKYVFPPNPDPPTQQMSLQLRERIPKNEGEETTEGMSWPHARRRRNDEWEDSW
jgi:hypothetical protein